MFKINTLLNYNTHSTLKITYHYNIKCKYENDDLLQTDLSNATGRI